MGPKEALSMVARDIRFRVDSGFREEVLAGFKSTMDSDPKLLFDGDKLRQFSLRTRYKIIAVLDEYRAEISKQRMQRFFNDMGKATDDLTKEIEGK